MSSGLADSVSHGGYALKSESMAARGHDARLLRAHPLDPRKLNWQDPGTTIRELETLKTGEVVPGCELKQGTHLRIV